MSSSFRMRLEEAIALYESVLAGSFMGFKSGRKAQASNCLVTVPWVRKDLIAAARASNRESGPFSIASLEYPPETSFLPGFMRQAASFTTLQVILPISFAAVLSITIFSKSNKIFYFQVSVFRYGVFQKVKDKLNGSL